MENSLPKMRQTTFLDDKSYKKSLENGYLQKEEEEDLMMSSPILLDFQNVLDSSYNPGEILGNQNENHDLTESKQRYNCNLSISKHSDICGSESEQQDDLKRIYNLDDLVASPLDTSSIWNGLSKEKRSKLVTRDFNGKLAIASTVENDKSLKRNFNEFNFESSPSIFTDDGGFSDLFNDSPIKTSRTSRDILQSPLNDKMEKDLESMTNIEKSSSPISRLDAPKLTLISQRLKNYGFNLKVSSPLNRQPSYVSISSSPMQPTLANEIESKTPKKSYFKQQALTEPTKKRPKEEFNIPQSEQKHQHFQKARSDFSNQNDTQPIEFNTSNSILSIPITNELEIASLFESEPLEKDLLMRSQQDDYEAHSRKLAIKRAIYGKNNTSSPDIILDGYKFEFEHKNRETTPEYHLISSADENMDNQETGYINLNRIKESGKSLSGMENYFNQFDFNPKRKNTKSKPSSIQQKAKGKHRRKFYRKKTTAK
jgi:hypothetical protein